MTIHEKYQDLSYGKCDYKQFRKYAIERVASIGWANLSDEEKLLAAKHFAVGKTERDQVLTFDEQIAHGQKYHRASISCRKERYHRFEVAILNRLVLADRNDLITYIATSGLPHIQNYVDRGREGTESGDPEGLYDYINATVGTSFVAIGLRTKTYVPYGMTMNELCDYCLEILRGNV